MQVLNGHSMKCDICILLLLMGGRKTCTKHDELLENFIRRVNLDASLARGPSVIYGSYVHFRKNLLSWKKLGIDPTIV